MISSVKKCPAKSRKRTPPLRMNINVLVLTCNFWQSKMGFKTTANTQWIQRTWYGCQDITHHAVQFRYQQHQGTLIFVPLNRWCHCIDLFPPLYMVKSKPPLFHSFLGTLHTYATPNFWRNTNCMLITYWKHWKSELVAKSSMLLNTCFVIFLYDN